MSLINSLRARQILDSRGNPTVEVDIYTEEGVVATASVPSGASTGEYEACELRDGDKAQYLGKGVLKAVDNVARYIEPLLLEEGVDVCEQGRIDSLLLKADGTPNKSKMGANALLAVSLACAKAASIEQNLPLYRYLGGIVGQTLPVPLMNVINGGAHANNGLDIQEFMLVPHGFSHFSQALRCGVEIFHTLKKLLSDKKFSTAVGDEGGFAPQLSHSREALQFLSEATEKAGYQLGTQVSFALDVAASELFKEGHYVFEGKNLSSSQLISIYGNLCKEFPIVSIEDGLDQNDWQGWKELTAQLGKGVQIVGDDLFVTHPKRLAQGIESSAANAILIKPNQIGTLTETLQTIAVAQKNGYRTVISHRSGETEEVFIADLAVAVNAGQIKTGSASRTDRVAKYNRLLRIEEQLGATASFYRW